MANELTNDRFRICRPDNTYGVPRFLNLNRKVFLSHSSGDKEFVWFLHERLCNCYHDAIAFFDIVTLPKAKPVSMKNILEEAKISQLGVLVLSEDFFMRTQNPMLELVQLTTSGVPLLPLFFGITVAQFKEESRRARWESQWEEWAVRDKVVVEKWKKALDVVNNFNGLEFDKAAKTQLEYIQEIVKEVTRIIRPAISFSEEGVFGKDRLCKIVEGMYKRSTLKRNNEEQIMHASTRSSVREDGPSAVYVVGVYGFAGLGKTTLCKSLCDYYFAEFNGKVCHIDLGSRPYDQDSSQTYTSDAYRLRMQYILAMLTDFINDDWPLTVSQVENVVQNQISSIMDPVFLAIDNVLSERESQEEVSFYLSLKFPKGSKIFLTSRSRSILENLASLLGSFQSVEVDHISPLELQEARDIFLHEIPKVRDLGVQNTQNDVDNLVNLCKMVWSKDRGQWAGYHPFMLKSLAASIKWKRTQNLDWKGRLAKLQSEGNIVDRNDAWKMVFKVLDISFANLKEEEKTLLLDLLLFYSATRSAWRIQDWVASVYSHVHTLNIEETLLQLEDLFFIRKQSRPPDLMVDFAKYKASQSLNPRYLVVDGELCPKSLLEHIGHVRHLSISRCVKARMLDLRHVEGLQVLHLVDNAGLEEVVLSRTTCAYLRSVIVRVPLGTSLHVIMNEDLSVSSAADRQHRMAVGPRWAEFGGNVILPTMRTTLLQASSVLSRLLRCLAITGAPVLDLGCLGNLLNLENLTLDRLPSVQAMDVTTWANLKSLDISHCAGLRALTIPNSSRLHSSIWWCTSLERVSFCTPSSYTEAGCSNRGSLAIYDCPTFHKVDGLVQYGGDFRAWQLDAANLEETFGDLLKAAGIDPSMCKAKADQLHLSGLQGGLAGATSIDVKDAQHIWLLLATLFEAQPACHLEELRIHCKEGGDCGCDRISPSSRPLQLSGILSLEYRCPQVRDLSRVARWDVLKTLDLSGCTSLEVWPDFTTMTSLTGLSLSGFTTMEGWPDFTAMTSLRRLTLSGCTSVKVWPDFTAMSFLNFLDLSGCSSMEGLPNFATMTSLETLGLSGCTSVEVLPGFATMTSLQRLYLSYTSLKGLPEGVQRLQYLDLRGCWQLAADELIKVMAREKHSRISSCGNCALRALTFDLTAGVRDRWLVMEALDSHFHGLCRHGCLDSWPSNIQVISCIIMLLYDFWFDEGCGAVSDCCKGAPTSIEAVQKMRRLLCSEFFMQWFSSYLGSRAVKGLADPYMAFALMGIAVVGAASIGWYNAAVNESLKNSVMNFLESCRNGKVGSSSTVLQQDHLFFRVDFFRPLSQCIDVWGARVPKLMERAVEGLWKIARKAEVGPDVIQSLEATLVSRNFLRYDLRWLFRSYLNGVGIQEVRREYWEPIFRAYCNLLGKSACQSVYDEWLWVPGSYRRKLKWQEVAVNL